MIEWWLLFTLGAVVGAVIYKFAWRRGEKFGRASGLREAGASWATLAPAPNLSPGVVVPFRMAGMEHDFVVTNTTHTGGSDGPAVHVALQDAESYTRERTYP